MKPMSPPKKTVAKVVMDDPADQRGKLKVLGGSASDKFNRLIADQAWNSLWIGSDPEQADDHVTAIAGALRGISPANELEGMLAAQLLAAHNAAMECYRRAMLPNQTFEGRQQALGQAGKLSRTFAGLLDTLHRQRGKAQQKVVVEHVHVHAGGQAVVGLVNTPGGGATPQIDGQPHAPQLANARQPPRLASNEEQDVVPTVQGVERLV